MIDHQDDSPEEEQPASHITSEKFPELAELEEQIQRRLRRNKNFLERFMDEDFDDLDDDDEVNEVDDGPDQEVEL